MNLLLVFAACMNVFQVICNWRIYRKCGAPGWVALLPIYKTWVLAKLLLQPRLFIYYSIALIFLLAVGIYILMDPPWHWLAMPPLQLSLFALALLVLTVCEIMLNHALSRAFGQNAAFTVGLLLARIIFRAVLAFGDFRFLLSGGTPHGDNTLLDS